MGRPKKEGGAVIKSFTLSEKEVQLMEFDKSREGFRSNSEYIGWLIRSRNQSVNPMQYLTELEKEESEILLRLQEIKTKKTTAMKNIEVSSQVELEQKKKRPQAIQIIKKKFLEDGIFVAKQIAKTWAILLNVEADELMAEVLIQTKKNQINYSNKTSEKLQRSGI